MCVSWGFVWETVGGLLEHLGGILGHLDAIVGVLERCFGDSGPSWTVLRVSWEDSEAVSALQRGPEEDWIPPD
eukprot:1734016-Pyramimonas_sp.AAC.1